jgi:hypothetical protein
MFSSLFGLKRGSANASVESLEEQRARHQKEITEMYERFRRERKAFWECYKKEMEMKMKKIET